MVKEGNTCFVKIVTFLMWDSLEAVPDCLPRGELVAMQELSDYLPM